MNKILTGLIVVALLVGTILLQIRYDKSGNETSRGLLLKEIERKNGELTNALVKVVFATLPFVTFGVLIWWCEMQRKKDQKELEREIRKVNLIYKHGMEAYRDFRGRDISGRKRYE